MMILFEKINNTADTDKTPYKNWDW